MASIPEGKLFLNLGGSCSDEEYISFLIKYRKSEVEGLVREALINYGSSPGLLLLEGHDYKAMEGWKTDHGTWLPKKLVSIRNMFRGKSSDSPKFVGTKTTMEFNPTDGSKAVVGMTRYNLLTTREDGDGLDLDEDLALCHVFPLEGKGKGTRNRNGKRSRSEYALDPPKPITHAGMEELDQIISDSRKYPILDVDMDVHLLLANQPSKHWQSFTKIYTKNPKLMYAACNHCNTILKLTSRRGAASSCRTSSLDSHSKSSKCTQKQLPSNSSTIIEHGVVQT